MIWIGVDPGGSGGIAFIPNNGSPAWAAKMPATDRDIVELLYSSTAPEYGTRFATLEKVHAMPKQGVSSTFKFGRNYGAVRMALVAASIPFEEVTPAAWQKAMGVPPRKDKTKTQHKNELKAKAQELFPHLKMTHAIADALLIAEFGRRTMTRDR